jgi:hypothetical protein
MKAFGKVEKGKLVLNNERKFKDSLHLFEGNEIEITDQESRTVYIGNG